MDKKIIAIACIAGLLSLGAGQAQNKKQVDVNKDGKPDVAYYYEGNDLKKVEADTNYDGKPDTVVYVEKGEFKGAEADTDYNGKADKKFDNTKQFKQWVNANHPEFNDTLGWDDYSRTIDKVFWKPGGKS
jgi:hypothetical protein